MLARPRSSPAPGDRPRKTLSARHNRTATRQARAYPDGRDDAGCGALRYPVKSLRGERLDAIEVGEDGVVGDRLAHVRQLSGRVVTSRFRPRLLGLQGSLDEAGEPLVGGVPWTSAEACAIVREAAGPSVELIRYRGDDRGQRFDVLPLTVLSDGMVETVGFDYRRFRPNILISGADGLAETDWPGYGLRIGDVLIGVRNPACAA